MAQWPEQQREQQRRSFGISFRDFRPVILGTLPEHLGHPVGSLVVVRADVFPGVRFSIS